MLPEKAGQTALQQEAANVLQQFIYSGRDAQGRLIKGVMEAPDRLSVVRHLQEKGCLAVSVVPFARALPAKGVPLGGEKHPADWRSAGYSKLFSFNLPGRFKLYPGLREVAVFTRQLAVLVGSGLPLLRALAVLRQQPHVLGGQEEVVAGIQEKVARGETLAGAFAAYPNIFSDFYVQMVRAGETSGALEEVLTRIAGVLEKEIEWRGKIVGALVYPAVIFFFVLGALSFLLAVVFPGFARTFAWLDVPLPWLTRELLQLSGWLSEKGVLLLTGLIGLCLAVAVIGRTPQGRKWRDSVLLRLPLAGRMAMRLTVARFASTLALLLSSGVPLLIALEVAEAAAGNAVFESRIAGARYSIQRGEGIVRPLAATGLFEPLALNLIAAGEESGRLGDMLQSVARFYELEVEQTLAVVVPLLEPLLVALLAVAVGVTAASIVLPMLDMINLL